MTKTDRPFFSIVIPTYNRSRWLPVTIESLTTQVCDMEIIVVDDGSTDDTEAVVRAIPDGRIRYFRTENKERGAARNFGTQQSRGAYINYFDSDDVYLPVLGELRDFLTGAGLPPVVFGGIAHGDSVGIASNSSARFGSFEDDLIANNFLGCGSVFVRLDIAMKFPFQEDRKLATAEDWELWLRLAAHYPFQSFSKDVFRLVHHEGRSLVTIDAARAIERELILEGLVAGNEHIVLRFSKARVSLFAADRHTFIALMQIVEGRRADALRSLRSAFLLSRHVVKRKRWWACVAKLIRPGRKS